LIEQTESRPRTDFTPIRAQGQESGQLVLLDLPKERGL
jgi:hypothetical protein